MSNYRYEGYGVVRDLKDDIPYHTDDIVDLLEEKDQQITELKKQLEEKEKYTYTGKEVGEIERKYETQLKEKEKIIEHWHNLYKERDKQFQSVRQRYHLLNKLQSNYDKKDKLHLLEMQCFDLVKENEEIKQQLKSQPAEICQKLIDMLTDRAELIEAGLCAEFMFTVYDLQESVEEILQEYQKGE